MPYLNTMSFKLKKKKCVLGLQVKDLTLRSLKSSKKKSQTCTCSMGIKLCHLKVKKIILQVVTILLQERKIFIQIPGFLSGTQGLQ